MAILLLALLLCSFPAANLLLTISDSIKLANFGLVRDLAVDGFGIAVASDITLDFRGMSFLP